VPGEGPGLDPLDHHLRHPIKLLAGETFGPALNENIVNHKNNYVHFLSPVNCLACCLWIPPSIVRMSIPGSHRSEPVPPNALHLKFSPATNFQTKHESYETK
jgi:hypothetical protein